MRIKVLRLYKDLLRYGQNLRYTDQELFKNKIKGNFRRSKDLSDVKDIEFQLQKGFQLLKDKRVI
ncbi:MIEF1 upstream open reading frame protein [Neodiprion virginianus]|uniref:MIEF1 upstream open reading frame protein n=1 Tax=Neodiprion fabricii TaxID=2872261 RepID=UPI001ED96BA9|nr:MIEF1 upstream open reading frame protein [Neodiprion fabricii]XP_046606118.1 MIEF1 upstream open reading frame protein [Neodiprion virginianus]